MILLPKSETVTETRSTIFSFVSNAHLSGLPKILQPNLKKPLSDNVSIVFGLISMLVLKFKIAVLEATDKMKVEVFQHVLVRYMKLQSTTYIK